MTFTDSDPTPTDSGRILDAIRIEAAQSRSIEMSYGGSSDIGQTRIENQDVFRVAPPVCVVADGMGGLAHGADAAKLAVDSLVREWQSGTDPLVVAHAVNLELLEGFGRAGIAGTTLLACQLAQSTLTFLNVGDSRAYLHRAGELRQLTRDQSVREALIELGRDEDSVPMGMLNALTSHIGMSDDDLQCQIFAVGLLPGDTILLSSDGIHGQLDHVEITDCLEMRDPQHAADDLVARAHSAGGRDNATAVVLGAGKWV